jgi:hypothetical protein
MTDVPPGRTPQDEIVERALAFVAEFKGDGRCALNCFYSEALAGEVLRLRSAAPTARSRPFNWPPDKGSAPSKWCAGDDPPETPVDMRLREGDARYLRGLVRAHRLHGGTVNQPTNVEVLERVLWAAGLYSGPVEITEAASPAVDPPPDTEPAP